MTLTGVAISTGPAPETPVDPTSIAATGDGVGITFPAMPADATELALQKCNDAGGSPDNDWAEIAVSAVGGAATVDNFGGVSSGVLQAASGYQSTKFHYRAVSNVGGISATVSATTVGLPAAPDEFSATSSDGNGIGATTPAASANCRAATPFILYVDNVTSGNRDAEQPFSFFPGAANETYLLQIKGQNIYGTGSLNTGANVLSHDAPGQPDEPTLDNGPLDPDTNPDPDITLPAAPADTITDATVEISVDGGAWVDVDEFPFGSSQTISGGGFTTTLQIRVKALTNAYGSGVSGAALGAYP